MKNLDENLEEDTQSVFTKQNIYKISIGILGSALFGAGTYYITSHVVGAESFAPYYTSLIGSIIGFESGICAGEENSECFF